MDSNDRLHEGIRLHYTQINLESTQILRYRTRLHQPPEEDLQIKERICTDRRREQHDRDQERYQTERSSVRLAFQHSSTEFTERRHPALAQERRKGNLSDHDHDCLMNLMFADEVLLVATSKEQLQKMLCDFKKVLKKWVSGSTQKRRKFSAIRVA